MFVDTYELAQKLNFKNEVKQLCSVISKTEKTVVIWIQTSENNRMIDQFITIDYYYNKWNEKIQKVNPINQERSFGGIQINENGHYLIQYDEKKSLIASYQRNNPTTRWSYFSTIKIHDYDNGNIQRNIFYFNNNIFVDCANILQIIQRRCCNLKIIRREKHFHNDSLHCLSYSQEKQLVAQSTDSTIFFWQSNNQKRWARIKPIQYDGELQPFYSFFNNQEIQVFLTSGLWIIDVETRQSFEFQDKEIIQTTTQASKNSFFQLSKTQELKYWKRTQNTNQYQRENLWYKNVKDILLSQSGDIFVTIKTHKGRVTVKIFQPKPKP